MSEKLIVRKHSLELSIHQGPTIHSIIFTEKAWTSHTSTVGRDLNTVAHQEIQGLGPLRDQLKRSFPFVHEVVDSEDGLDPFTALEEIADIIERVDIRASATDGPVPSTMEEMNQQEMSRIYELADKFRKARHG